MGSEMCIRDSFNHRAMRMNNNGQYTANIWLRYEVGSGSYSGIFARNGRNYFFEFGDSNNANGGFVHHRFKMGSNANAGVSNAYRVSPESWSMVTLMNQGNPGVAKTYINGAPIQTSTVNDTIWVEQQQPIYMAANANGNANWLKGSLQIFRLYFVAFSDA